MATIHMRAGKGEDLRDVLEALSRPRGVAKKSVSTIDMLQKWVADPDSIPKPLIEACRDAICMEFGDNGTDGYYKRILAKVFAAVIANDE